MTNINRAELLARPKAVTEALLAIGWRGRALAIRAEVDTLPVTALLIRRPDTF